MTRTLLIVISIWMPLVFCVLSQAGERPLPVVVGTLGDPGRLEFEGVKTFTAEKIRRALMTTPEFLLASHPAARFSEYLPAIKELVQTGYKHSGFSEPQVSTAFDRNRERFTVRVSEGPRYMCGDIEVRGAETVPVELLITRLTEPRIKKTDSLETKTEDPIWPKGRPASFSRASQAALTLMTRSILSELGYYFCTVDVEVVPDPGTPNARLKVEIKEEGARTISEIIIRGNKKNTREEILRYLELQEGMLLDHALILKTEDLLWRSARFLQYSVTPEVDAARAAIKLRIDLREYEPVPRLSEPFSPEEKMLLKCCDWLTGFLDQEDDLMIDLYIEEINLRLQVVISPTQGALLIARKGDDAQDTDMLNAVILVPKKIVFFSPTRKTKFVMPELSTQPIAQLSMTPNPDPNSDLQWVIMPGIGLRSNDSTISYSLDLNLAPVFFVSYAHKDDVDLTRLLDQGMVKFPDDTNSRVRIDTQSGRPIEMTGHLSGQGRVAVTLDTGIFDRLVESIEQATSEYGDGFNSQRPVGSTVRYLAETPLLHWALFQNFGAQLDVSEEALASAVTVLGKIMENTASPLDQWVTSGSGVVHDSFSIPPSSGKAQASLKSMLISAVAAQVFGANTQLFPPGSWPWTLARETVFVASGMGKYTQMEMGRTYVSPQTGPIGFLAAAKLLTYVNQPLSRAFAAKGLKTLTADDFRKDWSLLVAKDHLLSQCLDHMLQTLQSLDDQDLNRVLKLLAQAEGDLIRDLIKRRRENETESMHQVLAPVLEYHWQKQLKAKVEQALHAYANPDAIAGSAGKKAPAVSRATTKRSPAPASKTLQGMKKMVDSGSKASWSPDGNRLVFGRPQNKGLCILDLESGQKIDLTASGLDPAWSPDGRFIAYVERKSDMRSEEVWLMEPDGKSPRKLADGGYPSWSGDGKLLYVHSRKTDNILAIDMDNLDAEPEVFCDFSRSWYPTISPDGQRIAFGPIDALVIVDRQTREPILKWPTPGSRGLLPAWSPDGKQVAFGGFNNENLGIWVLNVETEKAVQVAKGRFTMPAWSRDGTRLAFDMRSGNRREIWMVETEALTGLKPSRLSKSNLTRLSLIDRNITDASLARQLEGITALRELVLQNTPITDAGLVHLKGLTSLERLLLGKTNITDAGLVHLKDLAALKHLCMHDTAISDAGLAQLQGLTSLETLCLGNTNITDAGLVHLQGLTSLKNLHVNGTKVTEAAVNALRCSLPNMATAKPKPKPAQAERPDISLIDRTPPDTSPISLAEPNEADNPAKTSENEETPEQWAARIRVERQGEEIHEASLCGDLERVKKATVRNPSIVDAQDARGNTALHYAAEKGHPEIVQWLLSQNAKPDIANHQNVTPLQSALEQGQYFGTNVNLPVPMDKEEIELLSQQPPVDTQQALLSQLSRGLTLAQPFLNRGSQDTYSRLASRLQALSKFAELPAHTPIKTGKMNIARELLNAGANPRTATSTLKTTPMHLAAANGFAEMITDLVMAGAEVDAKDALESAPIHQAATLGLEEIILELLRNGADPNLAGPGEVTPLMLAAQSGDFNTADVLISHGADVHARDRKSNSVMHGAAMGGDVQLGRLLLAKGVKHDSVNSAGVTPLFFAIRHNQLEFTKFLIEEGADIERRDASRFTPLLTAAEFGRSDILDFLFKEGANVNALTKDRRNALFLAAQGNHEETIHALLLMGIDQKALNMSSSTAFEVAIWSGAEEAVRAFLEEGDVDVNRSGFYGVSQTPMHAAVYGHQYLLREMKAKSRDNVAYAFLGTQKNYLTIARLLLKQGAKLDIRDRFGKTPLHYASEYGNVSGVQFLLANGADVRIQNSSGATPLMMAAQYGHTDIIKRLIEKGADVNTRSISAVTALMVASAMGHTETVRLLIKSGADVTAESMGQTAISGARSKGHAEIIKLLTQALQSQFDTWLSKGMPISPEEVRAYYDHVKDGQFIQEGKVQLRMIHIIPSKLEDSQVVSGEETREEAALRIATQLSERASQGEDFGDLAKTHSRGRMRLSGGLWPALKDPDNMTPPYNIAGKRAWNMQIGQVSKPIQINGDVFILTVENRVAKKTQSFDQVKDRLRKKLQASKRAKLEIALRGQ